MFIYDILYIYVCYLKFRSTSILYVIYFNGRKIMKFKIKCVSYVDTKFNSSLKDKSVLNGYTQVLNLILIYCTFTCQLFH